MTDLTATPGWAPIRQLESTDDATPILWNPIHQALLDRTEMLRASLTVENLAALRLVDSTKFTRVTVLSNTTIGDLGGGAYFVKSGDTVSSDNNGDRVVGADGARWWAASWGSLTPQKFGAKADSSFDSLDALQAVAAEASAIAAGERGPVVIDFQGRTFYTSGTVYLPSNVAFINGGLMPIGTPTIDQALVVSRNTNFAQLLNFLIDAQWKCAALLRNNAYESRVDMCHVQRFVNYGVKDTGGTAGMMGRSTLRQYVYGDSGWDVAANRNAPCLWADSADSMYSELVAYYGSVTQGCIYVTAPLNMFVNCHPFNGGTTDGANNVILRIEGSNASNNNFTNLYADNGVIQLVDNFKQSFNTVHYQRTGNANTTKAFELISTLANADAAGLSVINARFNGTTSEYLTYTASGSGSWAGQKKITWIGNRLVDGTPVGPVMQLGDKLTLDSAGRMLFGLAVSTQVNNLQSVLQAASGSPTGASLSFLKYGSDTSCATLSLAKSRGTAVGSYSGIKSGDTLGRLSFLGDDGSSGNYNATGARIEAIANSDWSGGNRDTDLAVWTTAYSTQTVALRWRFKGSGSLLPETTGASDIGSATNEVRNLYAQGAIFSGPVKLASYTVSTLPSAATYAQCMLYVSNGTSNKRLAVSDGTNWRWPDGAIVS